uniref:Uncharacterized protein n=1 Tax=Siphoviridae sp. ctvI513 TaxID=2827965 RepID=A0A8S5TJ54_9CAUD|nr:MAG TPA: hypothetical protein [Siphoviridae sp. ctvI513]
MRGVDRPTPRLALYTPEVETTAPAHPERLHITGSTPTRTPGRWTRCTGLHSISDRPRRVDRDGGGVVYNTYLLHTQHFCMLVRLILNMLLTCTFNHV